MVNSQNELWDILKSRLRKVMIKESKFLNQERNKIYNELTVKYVDLKRKLNRTIEEDLSVEELQKK